MANGIMLWTGVTINHRNTYSSLWNWTICHVTLHNLVNSSVFLLWNCKHYILAYWMVFLLWDRLFQLGHILQSSNEHNLNLVTSRFVMVVVTALLNSSHYEQNQHTFAFLLHYTTPTVQTTVDKTVSKTSVMYTSSKCERIIWKVLNQINCGLTLLVLTQ